MNKRHQSIIDSYRRSEKTELYQAYGSASKEKWEAWNKCKALTNSHNGSCLKILGANRYQFSAGCVFNDEQGNKCLLYITKSGIETIKLEED